jgi:hypothetical protein
MGGTAVSPKNRLNSLLDANHSKSTACENSVAHEADKNNAIPGLLRLDDCNPDVRRETVNRKGKNGPLGNAVAFAAILFIFAILLAEIFSGRSQTECGS